MNILVINAGSSSLKYQLFDMTTKDIKAKGLCERIGLDGKFTYKPQVEGKEAINAIDVAMPTHAEAIEAVLNALVDEKNGVIASMKEIDAVGHRVLHGGQKFSESVLINEPVIEAIKECIPLGPLHNPANLMGIEACAKVMPGVPQVAVFDTAFHQSMPKSSYMYAIPYEMYEKYGIRRYGFHGTSHRYVSAQAAELLGGAEGTKIITCHLGNGSSMAAVKDGKCFDTSMGLTPLEGVPMGTRSGSIDPAIVEVIANNEGMTPSQVLNMLNKKSGVMGLSGVSSDFRDLDNAAAEGNERAQLALDVFAYSVKKYIGSYAAALGGVDAIVFTAGLGENSPEMRAKIASGLEYMGVEIDAAKNAVRGTVDITGAGSKAKVFVIPTNEELVIAMDTQEIVSKL
ncbi:MAG: acetate kinase [Clostridia bacterium]|nr:acetate kinase [Clostridia bacterium]MBQ9966310.1 acetate kinase [Clostridia bacterium]